ncbi:efflux RND transporter periplasmic adaptor subunit [Consotaella salsifontis]|uniref:Membrane fusion protein, multidrug efflux system n=1 Tax=Consotaella salsifontis TaxID=1365950 RepID=A0A1T4T733_9HYPH|nr:efflux RND transporter periplasmic adaptor subunit [Consotaella salsifontis]SKA36315.1 membrane fusion protein, multidrug efflux system [Consotaella salsifontis]
MPLFSDFSRGALVAATLAFWLAGPASAQMGGQMPPPTVSIETVKPQPLPLTFEYAGRVVASREVEVRARVAGILLERKFEEGARVEKGQVLFQIDPKPYQAEVAAAQAAVQQAEAQLAQTQRQEKRAQELVRRQATSQATLDDATSARELAEAQLAAAQAKLQTAQLSLQYATVEAPVSGITSLEQVPEGSLLSNGDLLTKISQLDPIYVNFSAPDTETSFIRRLLDQKDGETQLSVGVEFGDGTKYDQTGSIDFTSSSIDQDTGTILSRAVLPNPNSRLLPGQFVRVIVSGIVVPDAVTIPTEALMQSPQGPFVYTVGEKDVVAIAPIQIGREIGGRTVINSGLKAGDRVITAGVIKARPNAPVKIDTGQGGQPQQEKSEQGQPQQGQPQQDKAQPDKAPSPAEAKQAEAPAEASK